MMRILFQGDSVTDAERKKEDGTNAGMGYPALVASKLGFDYPNEYEFVNRGISGNRVSDLLARLKRDMINEKPDVMSILIGVNDAWWEIVDQTGTREGLFETIYDLLIQELKAAIQTDIYLHVFTAAFSTIAKIWKQCKCLSTDGR